MPGRKITELPLLESIDVDDLLFVRDISTGDDKKSQVENLLASRIGGDTGSIDNAVLVADGVEGKTLKYSNVIIDEDEVVANGLIIGNKEESYTEFTNTDSGASCWCVPSQNNQINFNIGSTNLFKNISLKASDTISCYGLNILLSCSEGTLDLVGPAIEINGTNIQASFDSLEFIGNDGGASLEMIGPDVYLTMGSGGAITLNSSVIIDENGRVIVGGSSADAMVDIVCTTDIMGLKIKANASQSEDLLKIVSSDDSCLFVVNWQGDAGITVCSPNEPFHVQSDFDGNRGIRVGNESGGTSAVARFIVDVLDGSVFLAGYGSGFATTGARIANSGALVSTASMANGLSIVSNHSTGGHIRFYSGGNGDGNLRAIILNDGTIKLGDPDGTDYISVAANGFITLEGEARAWKCCDLDPANIGLPSTNPPDEDEYQGFKFDRYNRATEEQKYFVWHVPFDFAAGSASVRGHFGFLVENPPDGGGNEAVVMGYEYKKLSPGEVFDFTSGTTTGTITEVITDGEDPYKWHATSYGYCNTTGWASEDIILFRFFRDATNAADTYDNEVTPDDNDVWVRFYHMEYLKGSLGGTSA